MRANANPSTAGFRGTYQNSKPSARGNTGNFANSSTPAFNVTLHDYTHKLSGRPQIEGNSSIISIDGVSLI